MLKAAGPLIENLLDNIKAKDEEIEFFQSLLESKEFTKKEILLRSGDVSRYYYFIIEGCLKKYYINSEGKERIFEFATNKQWVGDQHSLWNQIPSMFNIIALENSKTIRISYTNLNTLLDQVPKFERYFRLIDNMAIRKHELRIKQSLACSAEERLIDFREAYPGLELRIAQKEIASFLGVSPEFLSTLKSKR